MKKLSLCRLLLVSLLMFVVGCGKSTSLEGRVVDGQLKPLANVKVMAKMSQPLKGYEQFETTTSADGSFKFGKLFPTSEYQLIFYSESKTKEKEIKTGSGPEGQTKMLPEPVMIRFMDSKEGFVLDTKMNLMWARENNGSDINWANAKTYCESYRGGGYTDWRMPTLNELQELYDASGGKYKIMAVDNCCPWASSGTRAGKGGSVADYFDFYTGKGSWDYQVLVISPHRVLPVRSVK